MPPKRQRQKSAEDEAYIEYPSKRPTLATGETNEAQNSQKSKEQFRDARTAKATLDKPLPTLKQKLNQPKASDADQPSQETPDAQPTEKSSNKRPASLQIGLPTTKKPRQDDTSSAGHLAEVSAKGPVGYEKYNAEYQGFPQGLIQKHCAPGADRIAWLTHYKPRLEDGGDVYFYSSLRASGGPFDFLSNFYPCKFKIPGVHPTHTFWCVEQAYQFTKAVIIDLFTTRYSNQTAPPTSSELLPHMILSEKSSALRIAHLGRVFDSHPDTMWHKAWTCIWQHTVEEALYNAISAKFRQNQELKERLLMTGNFDLYEASPKDKSCGIGMSAADVVWKKKTKEDFGMNLLGKIAMRVRDEIREEEGGWPEEFAFDYHRKIEELLSAKRDKEVSKKDKKQMRKEIEELKKAWVDRREENLRQAAQEEHETGGNGEDGLVHRATWLRLTSY